MECLLDKYKREICINCINPNCNNNIKETKYQEVAADQISTTTVVKCDGFIVKNKRESKPILVKGLIDIEKKKN